MDAAGAHRKEEDVMELGILTLLPPVVILLVALKTRNTTSSLVAGALFMLRAAIQNRFSHRLY